MRFISTRPLIQHLSLVIMAALWAPLSNAQDLTSQQPVVLVKDGVSQAPIIVSPTASTATKRAANELAQYIYEISGGRPEVIEGTPDPLPAQAIWVGFHPRLPQVFPDVALPYKKYEASDADASNPEGSMEIEGVVQGQAIGFDFKHAEEIVIVSKGGHVLIAGRDRSTGSMTSLKQVEFGSVNAVYTFIRDYLNVRWFWPGELGRDIPRQRTISLDTFEYRFHPPFLQRNELFPRIERRARLFNTQQRTKETVAWSSFARLHHSSLDASMNGHGFGDWWEKYHKSHPEYFALQPDGTRSGFPRPGNAKLCQSNPAVWDQWIRNVEEQLKANPSTKVFNVAPNDSHASGICVCENCRALDAADGTPFTYRWQGHSETYVAMSDRYITFANQLGRKLKERFPNRDDLYVGTFAYGPSSQPPVHVKADDNVIVGFVGHFPLTTAAAREQQKQHWVGWSKMAPHMFYRPNLFYWGAGVWGFPEVSLQATIEDFKFLADENCIGMYVDTTREHWATLGPQLYLMTQLAWNPHQDGQAVLDDYYTRAFGEAAPSIAKYWQHLDDKRAQFIESPDYKSGSANRFLMTALLAKVYDEAFFTRGYALLDEAEAALKDASSEYVERHRQRVKFVRAGLDFLQLMTANIALMNKARASGGHDKQAVNQVVANWETIRKIHEAWPYAISYDNLYRYQMQGATYFGQMHPYFGPPSKELLEVSQENIKPVSYQPAKWKLVIDEPMTSQSLARNWVQAQGKWAVENGQIVSDRGLLLLAAPVNGLQRIELNVIAPSADNVSDISPALHLNESDIASGYLLQFGGLNNTINRLRRQNLTVDQNTTPLIVPGKAHHIVAESDGANIRLTVDHKVVLQYSEKGLLRGEGQNRLGIYCYSPIRIQHIKVYESPAVEIAAD